MYKELTDPIEQAKLRRKTQNEKRKKEKISDTGL